MRKFKKILPLIEILIFIGFIYCESNDENSESKEIEPSKEEQEARKELMKDSAKLYLSKKKVLKIYYEDKANDTKPALDIAKDATEYIEKYKVQLTPTKADTLSKNVNVTLNIFIDACKEKTSVTNQFTELYGKFGKIADEQKKHWKAISKCINDNVGVLRYVGKKSESATEAVVPDQDKKGKETFDKLTETSQKFYNSTNEFITNVTNEIKNSTDQTPIIPISSDLNKTKTEVKSLINSIYLSKYYNQLYQYYINREKLDVGKLKYTLVQSHSYVGALLKKLESTLYQPDTTDTSENGKKKNQVIQKLRAIHTYCIPKSIEEAHIKIIAMSHYPAKTPEDREKHIKKCIKEIENLYDSIISNIYKGLSKGSVYTNITDRWKSQIELLKIAHTTVLSSFMNLLSGNTNESVSTLQQVIENNIVVKGEKKTKLELSGNCSISGLDVANWFMDKDKETTFFQSFIQKLKTIVMVPWNFFKNTFQYFKVSLLTAGHWPALVAKDIEDKELKQLVTKGSEILVNITTVLEYLPNVFYLEHKSEIYEEIKKKCHKSSLVHIGFLFWSKVAYLRDTYKIDTPQMSYVYESLIEVDKLFNKKNNGIDWELKTIKPLFYFQPKDTKEVAKTIVSVGIEYDKYVQNVSSDKLITSDKKKEVSSASKEYLDLKIDTAEIAGMYSFKDIENVAHKIQKSIERLISHICRKLTPDNFIKTYRNGEEFDGAIKAIEAWTVPHETTTAAIEEYKKANLPEQLKVVGESGKDLETQMNLVEANLRKGIGGLIYTIGDALHTLLPDDYQSPELEEIKDAQEQESQIANPVIQHKRERRRVPEAKKEQPKKEEDGIWDKYKSVIIGVGVICILGVCGGVGLYFYRKKRAES